MKRKILLVEDDIELNETICDFLQIKDFKVSSLTDGSEVVNLIYEKKFDLILLDVKLPNQNGFNIAKQIREFSEVPIVFITSLNSLENIENGFMLGGDDYLTKPFSLNDSCILKILSGIVILPIHSPNFDSRVNLCIYVK